MLSPHQYSYLLHEASKLWPQEASLCLPRPYSFPFGPPAPATLSARHHDLYMRWHTLFLALKHPSLPAPLPKSSQSASLLLQYFFAPPSSFGLPYLVHTASHALEGRYPVSNEDIFSILYSGVVDSQPMPGVMTTIISGYVRRLCKQPPMNPRQLLPLQSLIRRTPWKALSDNDSLRALCRGSLDKPPPLLHLLPAWSDLQPHCLGHVPALVVGIFCTPEIEEDNMSFRLVARCLLHDCLDHTFSTFFKNERGIRDRRTTERGRYIPPDAFSVSLYPVLKLLVLMLLNSRYNKEEFESDSLDVFASKYGINLRQDWGTPHDDVYRCVTSLTSPGASCYTTPLAHGFAAMIETLRYFCLYDPAPGWVVLNFRQMGISAPGRNC